MQNVIDQSDGVTAPQSYITGLKNVHVAVMAAFSVFGHFLVHLVFVRADLTGMVISFPIAQYETSVFFTMSMQFLWNIAVLVLMFIVTAMSTAITLLDSTEINKYGAKLFLLLTTFLAIVMNIWFSLISTDRLRFTPVVILLVLHLLDQLLTVTHLSTTPSLNPMLRVLTCNLVAFVSASYIVISVQTISIWVYYSLLLNNERIISLAMFNLLKVYVTCNEMKFHELSAFTYLHYLVFLCHDFGQNQYTLMTESRSEFIEQYGCLLVTLGCICAKIARNQRTYHASIRSLTRKRSSFGRDNALYHKVSDRLS